MGYSGPCITHYEVYCFDGQRWTVQARYRSSEGEAAVTEARQIEHSLSIATKVVRESYYPDANATEEQTVYVSDKSLREAQARKILQQHAAAPRGPGGQLPGQSAALAAAEALMVSAADLSRSGRKAIRPKESMGIFLKLIIVISASLIGASAVTGIVSAVAAKFPEYSVQLSGQTMSLIMFTVFVTAFLLFAVPLAMTLINWQNEFGGSAPRRPAPRPMAPPKPRRMAPPPVSASQADEPPLPEPELDDDLPPLAELQGEQTLAPIPDLDAAPVHEEPQESPAERQERAEKQLQDTMIQFLETLLGAIKQSRPQLDSYNLFGVNLMLAGAIEVLGIRHHLESEDKRQVLADTIKSMGTRGETAKTFSEKYEEYMVEPRYMSMVQQGRTAMSDHLGGVATSAQVIGDAIEEWNKPHAVQQTAQARIVTVLFTDMVGSTDMTQAKGDSAAQDIVRHHNSIVRACLRQYNGKEIKHTGDGIMASFPSAVHGVDAAASIQKLVADHNARQPDLTMHLRIGMNAGEPIEEEDDLFGSTVQLAARICAKADTDQILCSNVVRELAAGRANLFAAQGEHEMKGFREKFPLYEVMWRGR